MTEPEVSLRLALYYLRRRLTRREVRVSIDGAHIKTGNTVHFDIRGFLSEQGCTKADGDLHRWQGGYRSGQFAPALLVDSLPGAGDVRIALPDGRTLYVESKKSRPGPPSHEYSLMREAIGQLMTGCPSSPPWRFPARKRAWSWPSAGPLWRRSKK